MQALRTWFRQYPPSGILVGALVGLLLGLGVLGADRLLHGPPPHRGGIQPHLVIAHSRGAYWERPASWFQEDPLLGIPGFDGFVEGLRGEARREVEVPVVHGGYPELACLALILLAGGLVGFAVPAVGRGTEAALGLLGAYLALLSWSPGTPGLGALFRVLVTGIWSLGGVVLLWGVVRRFRHRGDGGESSQAGVPEEGRRGWLPDYPLGCFLLGGGLAVLLSGAAGLGEAPRGTWGPGSPRILVEVGPSLETVSEQNVGENARPVRVFHLFLLGVVDPVLLALGLLALETRREQDPRAGLLVNLLGSYHLVLFFGTLSSRARWLWLLFRGGVTLTWLGIAVALLRSRRD